MEKREKTRKFAALSTAVAVGLSATTIVLHQESGSVQPTPRDGTTIGQSTGESPAKIQLARTDRG